MRRTHGCIAGVSISGGSGKCRVSWVSPITVLVLQRRGYSLLSQQVMRQRGSVGEGAAILSEQRRRRICK